MILFVDQSGDMGGAQTVLLSLLEAATEHGPVTVLAPGGGALEAEIASRFANQIKFVPCEEPSFTRGHKGMKDIIRLAEYLWRFRKHASLFHSARLVYCNGSRLFLAMPLFARSKVIYHIHTDYSALEKRIIRACAQRASTYAIVSNSRFIASRLRLPSIVIENALDRRFAQIPFQDRFQNSAPPFHAAVVGTIAPQKGQDIAAQAAKDLPIQLHLIGGTPSDCVMWAASIDNVTFAGVTHDVPGTIDKLAIQFNLVPSTCEEAFGLAAIEGMSNSCITLVSGKGGLAEIAAKTGAIIARDVDELHAALKHLVSLPPHALAALAKSQYQATQEAYAPKRFMREAGNLIADAIVTTPDRL